jgi:alpha-1,3-fucosyltransferase
MRDSLDLPSQRPISQRWIFMLMESPIHSYNYKHLNNFYNQTATYRIDSDYSGVYEESAEMDWALNDSFNQDFDFHSTKSDFAAAVISNCGGSSDRLNYIRRLEKLIKVDTFGKCGKKCPEYYRSTDLKGDCKDIIGKEYMFYFAFENSICTDYITEKFFFILRHNIIPVVLGGGKYDHYVLLFFIFLPQNYFNLF